MAIKNVGTIGKVQGQHLFVVLVFFCCLKIFLNDFEDRVTVQKGLTENVIKRIKKRLIKMEGLFVKNGEKRNMGKIKIYKKICQTLDLE